MAQIESERSFTTSRSVLGFKALKNEVRHGFLINPKHRQFIENAKVPCTGIQFINQVETFLLGEPTGQSVKDSTIIHEAGHLLILQ